MEVKESKITIEIISLNESVMIKRGNIDDSIHWTDSNHYNIIK